MQRNALSNVKAQQQKLHYNSVFVWQVGIIALNLVGQVIQAENMSAAPSFVSNHYQPSNISAAAGAMADLSLDVNVDPVTAGKIREINRHKEAAVAKEDYDEAKRLKLAIERLKAVGQKVAQLEARKRHVSSLTDLTLAYLIFCLQMHMCLHHTCLLICSGLLAMHSIQVIR